MKSPVRGVFKGDGNWLRNTEHIALRVVSLVFSIGSAYQVRWFFEPLDIGDPIHYVLWWLVAAGFGLLGFFLSRMLAHRLMVKEQVWAYVPVFVLVEFFEILCNYAKAVSVVSAGSVSWVAHAPVAQQPVMVVLTYVGWSIIPIVSPAMSVADMDMTRQRNGETAMMHHPQLVIQRGPTQQSQQVPQRPTAPQQQVQRVQAIQQTPQRSQGPQHMGQRGGVTHNIPLEGIVQPGQV